MNPNTFTYKTINQKSNAEFSDRGSKFIAFVYPIQYVEEVKPIVKSLKEIHPKAVHFCYAYRVGFDNNLYRANDDGEPSGSAGRPILGQIDSAEITNVLIVVVRYFGGVLLGVPGLINAYKTVSLLGLNENTIIEKNKLLYVKINFDYTIMNDVMRIIKQFNCEIVSQSMLLFCEIDLGIILSEKDIVLQKLENLQGLELHIEN